MIKVVLVLGFIGTVFCSVQSEREKLSRLKRVEAYEVLPGIVAMPRYTADGQICEIALEKLHHSAGTIRFNPTLTSAEVDKIADQLVPSEARGPKPSDPSEQGGGGISGRTMESSEEYQNISIRTYQEVVGTFGKGKMSAGDISAVTIKWKHRACQTFNGHDAE